MAAIRAAFSRRAAASGSSLASTLVITAAPLAPAAITWAIFSAVMPPMASNGTATPAARMRCNKPGPDGSSPGCERVANMVPTSRKSAPDAAAAFAPSTECTERPITASPPTMVRTTSVAIAASPSCAPPAPLAAATSALSLTSSSA